MSEDDLQALLTKHFYHCTPEAIPIEVRPRVFELLKESDRLETLIARLGERLGAGENGVRAELNPAIRRRNEIGKELFGLMPPESDVFTQVMYGPPWSFDSDE